MRAAPEPPDDLLSLAVAAEQQPHDLALKTPREALSFQCLWERVEPWLTHRLAPILGAAIPSRSVDAAIQSLPPPLALVAYPTVGTLCAFYAALQAHVPLLLVHPRLGAEVRRELLFRNGIEWLVDGLEIQREAVPTRAVVRPGEQFLIATSGSTGPAKIAVLSRAAVLASAHASAMHLGWNTEDRWLLNLPYSHVGGLSVLTRCLIARRPVVLSQRRPGEDGFREELNADGVSLLSLVPTQLHDLMHITAPRSVRAVLVGGAAAAPGALQRAREQGWPLLCTYGLTEMASQVATESPASADGTSVGCPLPGVELRLREGGRIELRGPSLFNRYLGTDLPLTEDGFFRTSDRGRLTADGRLQVLGRLDNVVISGGENVSPEWIEQQLSDLPGIRELAVVGAPDERWGARLVLAVVEAHPRLWWESFDDPSADGGRARVLAEARRRLPHYAVPKAIVAVPSLPRTSLGKLDRRRLAEQVIQLLAEPD